MQYEEKPIINFMALLHPQTLEESILQTKCKTFGLVQIKIFFKLFGQIVII